VTVRRGSLTLLFSLGLALPILACGDRSARPATSAALIGQGAPIRFRYSTPEGASLGDTELLGRETLLLYLTTYDAVSLAVARRLGELWHRRNPRFNAVLVALEPPDNAPLVAVYRDSLANGLLAALADSATLEGGGPLGDLRQIPAVVLMDRDGRVVFRGFGVEAYRKAESLLAPDAVAP
jgi:hypothetical protein